MAVPAHPVRDTTLVMIASCLLTVLPNGRIHILAYPNIISLCPAISSYLVPMFVNYPSDTNHTSETTIRRKQIILCRSPASPTSS